MALYRWKYLELSLLYLLLECVRLGLNLLPILLILFSSLHPWNLNYFSVVLLNEIPQFYEVVLHLLVMVEHAVRSRFGSNDIKLLEEVLRVADVVITTTAIATAVTVTVADRAGAAEAALRRRVGHAHL